MTMAHTPLLRSDIAAALDWWREAGVDFDYAEDPQAWVSPPEDTSGAPAPMVVAAPPPPPPVRRYGEVADWPTDLAAFQAWWLGEPALDDGQTEGRVAPRGPTGAELMVIVPEPEVGDAESGALLSGLRGRLLAAMLGAMGLAPEAVYVASCLPRATPAADWVGLAESGLGEVLAHHIALAAPRRILTLGGCIPPLLGLDPAKTPAILPINNHNGASGTGRELPILAAHELGLLAQRPQAKAALWRRWLAWTG